MSENFLRCNQHFFNIKVAFAIFFLQIFPYIYCNYYFFFTENGKQFGVEIGVLIAAWGVALFVLPLIFSVGQRDYVFTKNNILIHQKKVGVGLIPNTVKEYRWSDIVGWCHGATVVQMKTIPMLEIFLKDNFVMDISGPDLFANEEKIDFELFDTYIKQQLNALPNNYKNIPKSNKLYISLSIASYALPIMWFILLFIGIVSGKPNFFLMINFVLVFIIIMVTKKVVKFKKELDEMDD